MLMYLSFTSYLYVSLAVVGLYYAIILCVFYRTELQAVLLQSKSVTNYSPNKTATGGTTDPLVFDLVDELGALLVQLEAQKCGRLELFPFISKKESGLTIPDCKNIDEATFLMSLAIGIFSYIEVAS